MADNKLPILPDLRKHKGIIGTIIDNPTLIILVVALLVVFGLFGLDRMNKQEFPEFVIRQGVVAAVYPGASAEEVEQQVSKPLEEYLFSFEEVDKEATYSYSREGIVYVYVTLDNSVMNQTEVWSKIRHGLKDFKMQLPTGVLAIAVVDDFGNTTALLITMESQDKTYREMERYMDLLKQRLRTVPAVGNIKSYGEQREEIAVTVDKEKLATYGISQSMLTARLFTQGLVSIGGTLEMGNNELPLHVRSPYVSELEIGDQIIYSTPDGKSVKLKDVAQIERRYAEPTSFITKDGNKALVLSVEMRQGNNIVKFGENVDAVLRDFQRTLPEDVSLYRITDLSKVVNDSIWGFMKDLCTAIIVVILVMLLLFPFTSAMIPAIEIPLTTAVTFAVMYIVGYEMNIVTLAALIVTLGMIVDDSIVIIDGYMDYLRQGMERREAAIRSAKNFFPSLALATLVICGIFFPFLFTMHGPLADFVKFFPTTISISLVTSLALTMLLTPYLAQKIVKRDNAGEEPHRQEAETEADPKAASSVRRARKKLKAKGSNVLVRWQNRFFQALQGGYERLLDYCFRHPVGTVLVGVGSVVVAVVLFLLLPLQLMPKAERDSFAVEIYLPEGTALDETARVAQQFEEVLQSDRDVLSVTTFVGSSSPRFMAAYSPHMPSANFAQMIVKTEGHYATERIIRRYHDSYAEFYPEAYIRVKQLDYQGVVNPIEIRLRGENAADLRRYSDTLMNYMRQFPEDLVWVHSDWDGYVPSVSIDMKPEEASRLGVSKSLLSANLAMLYGGVPMTSVWEGDYEVPVKLYSGERADSLALANTLVPTTLSQFWVPLRQLAEVYPDWQPAQIAHRNGMRCVTVGCDLAFAQSQPVAMSKLKPWLEGDFREMLPDDVEMTYGGLDEVNASTMDDIILGMVFSLLIVFFFLLFHFKKVRLTLLAFGGMLLCLLGAFVGLAVFGCDVSLTAIIGVVSLIGINVRNTIVMFDYAEELRATGMPIREVAYQCGCRRMRPIFLTSTTTAVGVIPMIYHRSTLWMPMGIVICFGTLCAIAFVVTVLPVAYWKLFSRKESDV